MASILFDDITFPRELYDPDTLEFVAPVSTLLAFTPHILSQLAKTSEDAQEPLPAGWQASGASAAASSTAAPNSPDGHPKVKIEGASSSSTAESGTGTASNGGFFSSFANLANHQTLGNGLYLAGRFMDGNAASSSSARSYERERAWERERDSRAGTNYWFGSTNYSHPQQERARMREMEDRLRAMERELDQNKAMARSEVEQQRRDRFNLEQELETQRAKVQKLEQEMDKEQKKREKEKKDQDEKEKQRKKQADKEKEKESKKSEKASSKEEDEDNSSSKAVVREDDTVKAAKAVLVATVGVASLVMAMYSAHKASSTYSVVTFHSQLEQLMSECDGVVQSTEAWISEQFLEVPDQIRQDLKLIKELMENIHRLDPRSEKKAETVAWSMSAVGSLGAVGGAVVGSTMAMASGGTLVVGCALYGIITRSRYNGPEYSAARTMMEHQTVRTLRALGVNPSSSASSSTGGSRTSAIHESRLQRLRIEFEKREGHDLRDADEIDGLAVEEAMKTSSFSAPFVSLKKKANEDSELASLLARAQRQQDQKPHLTMKRAVATA